MENHSIDIAQDAVYEVFLHLISEPRLNSDSDNLSIRLVHRLRPEGRNCLARLVYVCKSFSQVAFGFSWKNLVVDTEGSQP